MSGGGASVVFEDIVVVRCSLDVLRIGLQIKLLVRNTAQSLYHSMKRAKRRQCIRSMQ